MSVCLVIDTNLIGDKDIQSISQASVLCVMVIISLQLFISVTKIIACGKIAAA